MTFLNPFVLLGIVAAGIPILLHLLNLRRLKTIEFSTLSFLKELQRSSIRRVKIRQWLLLALRTLLIALLVMAFSRPTLRGTLSGGFAERAKTTAVILLDDSPSLTASNEHGQLFSQALTSSLQIVDAMNDGDEVYFLPLSSVRGESMPQVVPYRTFSALKSVIQESKPSFAHPDIESGLRAGMQLLSASKNFNKELFLISDGQRSQWKESGNGLAKSIPAPDVHLFVAELSPKTSSNASVTDVRLPGAFYEVGKPFPLEAAVVQPQRSGGPPVVSIFLNGVRSAQTVAKQSGAGTATTELTVAPKQSGLVTGKVALEDDDVEFDNTRYFAVTIPDRIRVLMIGEQNELAFLRVALLLRDRDGGFDVHETTPSRLTAQAIANSDVVLVCGPERLSSSSLRRIKEFAESGGGIILLADSRSDSAHAAAASSELRLPAPHGIESVAKNSKALIVFNRYDARHPVFADVFAQQVSGRSTGVPQKAELESPAIRRTFRLTPSATGKTLIGLSIGSPFLLEERIGKGRAFIFSVAANSQWSDFQVQSLFAPLLNSAVQYLSGGKSFSPSVFVNDEVVLALPTNEGNNLSVRRPNNTSILVQGSSTGTGRTLRFQETTLPGVYGVQAGKDTVAAFTVNVDPAEMDTRTVSNELRERVYTRVGILPDKVRGIASPERTKAVLLESRLGTELWKYFALAALLIALVEMAVARERTHNGERS